MAGIPSIQERVLELDRLDRQIVKAIATGDREHLPTLLETFVERRKALLVELLPGSAEQVQCKNGVRVNFGPEKSDV